MKRRTSSTSHETTMTPNALAALETAGFSRRDFLKGSGALIVTFSAVGAGAKLAEPTTGEALATPLQGVPGDKVDSWIAIAADGNVTGYVGKCEIGQGIFTVHHQMAAEELYVPISRVKIIQCDTDICPGQGVTAGSNSHPNQFQTLTGFRQALASAREELFRQASTRLGVPVDQLTVKDGVISSKSDASKKVSYAELVGGKKLNVSLDPRAKVKDPKDYTVLGTSVPRYNLVDIATGRFEYVHTKRVPGMLHGRVVRPPAVGAKVLSIDDSSVANYPGAKVVRKENFVGVVAPKEWDAIQAAEKLKVTWTTGVGLPKQQDLYDFMRKQPKRDSLTVDSGDVDAMLASAARVIKATYLHPYQMHGSLAASCAVADVKVDGGKAVSATIWCASQNVTEQRNTVARLLGITSQSSVHVIFMTGSGCYGINGADTVGFDAALLSAAVGKPVRVLLSRKDEMAWENYGPAFVIDQRVGLDSQGNITVWDHESWTLGKGGRPSSTTPGNVVTEETAGFPGAAFQPTTQPPVVPQVYGNGGNSAPSYVRGCGANGGCGGTGIVKSERVLTHSIASPFFTGPLRAPARLQNTFCHESFMDEVPAAVKADPFDYRLRHLKDDNSTQLVSGTRLKDVIRLAANKYNWDTRYSPKAGNPLTGIVTGRGLSCMLYEGDNGYGAIVAEVEVNQDTGKVRVKRFVVAADSGPVSNPNGFHNQNEGGTLQGMSRALVEEVTWDDQKITSFDWVTYPTFRFGEDLPMVDSYLIDRRDAVQQGAGEVAITAVAAAIGNAIFDATGARIRQLPFTPARVLAALKART